MMKILASIIALVVVVATAIQLYNLREERASLQASVTKTSKELDVVNKENAKLEEEIAYLKNPENLEREARAQFNYARPNEKLLIIVNQEKQ